MASGELVESYCGGAHDAVDLAETDKSKSTTIKPCSRRRYSSTTKPNYLSVPHSDEMSPEPTHPFNIAIESDDGFNPYHQVKTRSGMLLNHYNNVVVMNASAKVWQSTNGPHMLVKSGPGSSDDTIIIQIPIYGSRLTDASTDDAQAFSSRSCKECLSHRDRSRRGSISRPVLPSMNDIDGKPADPNPCGTGVSEQRHWNFHFIIKVH